MALSVREGAHDNPKQRSFLSSCPSSHLGFSLSCFFSLLVLLKRVVSNMVGVGLQVDKDEHFEGEDGGGTRFRVPALDGMCGCCEGIHPFLDNHLQLDELSKLFQNGVPSLDGLPKEFCHPCLEISRKALDVLKEPSLFNDIDYFSSSFCHILPSDLEEKCVKMVDMHKHGAVMFLQDAFTEGNFCYNSGFCPDKTEKSLSSANSKSELLAAMEPFLKLLTQMQKELMTEGASGLMKSAKTLTMKEIPAELRSNGSCAACHSLLDKVRNELQDPDKQMKIINSLLKACEVEVFVYRCKKLVFAYGPLVISNLQRIVSMDICHMVHICDEDPRNQSSHMNMMNFRNSRQHLQSSLAKLD
ncbi:hypothetical protein Taro_020315 [Colocasia esculenta]|uniref:Saposin B-type domain-containing protein n=1 Tax=Colocasia esculenta TaxID=4460 RepID=A0A843V1S3_COLES|nr:hypothetical protein [Colocasia esculenta]